MRVDLHLLRTFLAVVRHGSFSGAARELGYTQSAVSQHIASLEADLGAPLLGRRPVTPTAVGARLLEHAGPLLLRADAARADIRRMTAPVTSSVTVAVTPLAGIESLAGALARERETSPGVRIRLRVAGAGAVLAAVAAGEVDVGLVDGVAAPTDPLHLPDTGPLSSVRVCERPLAVAMPVTHPLAVRTVLGVELTDLADALWIDAPDIAVPLAHLRTVGGVDGFRSHVRYDGSDVRGLLAVVASGHGLVLLPAGAVEGSAGLAAVPLSGPRLVHRTEILYSGVLGAVGRRLAEGSRGGG